MRLSQRPGLWTTVILGAATKYATGQQCQVGGGGGASLYGTAGCPCLQEDSASGALARSPVGLPNALNVTLNWDGVGQFDDGVERNYGHLCGTHDVGSALWCLNMSDPATANSWCSSTWCWVDPDNCDVASSATSYFPGTELYYSYAACDSADTYSSNNDDMGEHVEVERVKLKAEMAIGFVEQITGVPTRDTFVQLLADLDIFDTWDYDRVLETVLMQTYHLINNQAPFGCVHIGDSRGMWYGLFNTLAMGYRAPDPATPDMYAAEWFRPFTPDTINGRQLDGDLPSSGGLFAADGDCSNVDPRMRCNWPTWEGCDGTGERIVTETAVSQYDGLTESSFSIGAGNTCFGVLIVTSVIDGVGQQAHLETVETCLHAGENEFAHTHDDLHVVELFYQGGYVHSGPHTGAGNTTRFVVGECTHVLVRVTSISDGVTATWTVASTQGSWEIVTSEAGTYEEERCVYDHEYTVSRNAPESYDGSIEVLIFTRCSAETCCMADQLYFENAPRDPVSAGPGELYHVQQFDPRVRAWYYNAPIQYALTGQVFGWSHVYAPVGAGTADLTISATRILPGDSGSVGSDATRGACLGDYYIGADFSAAPGVLVVTVDGSDISVPLSGDLSAPSDAVAALNAGLGGAASAVLDATGNRIQIESAQVGSGSTISIAGGSEAARLFGFSASTQVDGSDATAGTYIAERVPHRASGANAPSDPPDPAAWVGFDFSTSPEDLVLVVDGVNITIPLTTNLDDYSDAVDIINAGLDGAGSASLDDEGKYLTISSSTTGTGSSVSLGPQSGDSAKKMLCPVVKSVLTVDLYLDDISEALAATFDETDAVYIVERSTGLLIADSTGEGVTDEYNNRRCAVSTSHELVRESAYILDNLEPKWDEMSSILDETHFFDAILYQRDETQTGWGIDWLVVVVQLEQCPAGQSLQQLGPVVACNSCPVGEVSRQGLECIACPQGTVANMQQSECDQCPEGSYANGAQTQCIECPVFQVASEQGDSCVCASGYYDSQQISPSCHLGDFEDTTAPIADSELQCWSCKAMPCLAGCQHTSLVVEPGWMILDEEAGNNVNIFRCNYHDACPGGSNATCAVGYESTICALCENDYVLDAGDGECTPCGEMNKSGFVAALILLMLLVYVLLNIRVWFNAFGNCATVIGFMDNLELKPVGKCLIATLQILGGLAANLKVIFPVTFQTFLDDFVAYFRFDIVGILIHLEFGCITDGRYQSSLRITFLMIAIVVAGVGVYYVYRTWADEHKTVGDEERKEIAAEIFGRFDLDGKGINRDEVGKIAARIAPDATGPEIDALFEKADKDRGGTIDFDEFYAAAYNEPTTEATSTEAGAGMDDDLKTDSSPTLDFAGLVRRRRHTDRITEALTGLFIAIFLLYPGVTNKIFDGLTCRHLGGLTVLDVDYSIDCEATYFQRQLVNGSLVVLWPIGIPVVLAVILWRKRELITQEDEATLQEFDFIIGDYTIECWYWEIAELARKLLLTGLIGLFHRGSIAQSFVATIISFFFFALSVRFQPFKNPAFNAVKVFTEFQIFGILVVCVVLQTDRYGLPASGTGSAEDYGMFQVVLTLAVLPLIIYVIYRNAKGANERLKENRTTKDEEEYDNPNFKGDIATVFDTEGDTSTATFDTEGDTSTATFDTEGDFDGKK